MKVVENGIERDATPEEKARIKQGKASKGISFGDAIECIVIFYNEPDEDDDDNEEDYDD